MVVTTTRSLFSLGRFVATYVRANFQVALEYRVSFWAQVFAMMVNDAMWVAFWAIFFQRFPVVRNYEFQDVVMLWAVGAFSFGIGTGIFGNCWRYAAQVAQGGLDFFLVLPKPVLLHLIVSRTSVSAWGDAIFGLAVFVVFVRPTPAQFGLFLLLSVAAAAIFVAYAILANALAFWFGNAEGFAQQLQNALLTFALYPVTLFSGVVKALLFTAIPAAFVAYVPAQLLREWNWPLALGLAGAAAVSVVAAIGVFYAGLRRYESGNLLAMRG